MNFLARFSIVLLLFNVCVSLAGEPDPPIEWGEVSREDLTLTSFPADSNATAVVLCDYGSVKFNQQYDLIYKRHRRIKILTKSGFDWGTHKVSYYVKDRTQDVDDIEGQTFMLDANGKVTVTELEDDAIFDEETGENWRQVKFTLPALSPGCIIEYRYTVNSTNAWYMPDWEFQTTEPVLWSEFRMKTPIVFLYALVQQGYLQYHVNTNEMTKEVFTGRAGTEIIDMNFARYVVKDAPAMREEPYITTLDDYRMRMATQLAIVNWPGERGRRYLESWEKVVEELSNHIRFGKQLSGWGAVRKKTEEVIKGKIDLLQRLEAIYDFIRNTIVWNGRHRVFATEDIDNILESKTGSSADINLLLTLMLREAQIDARPVLLSTRQNGKIQTMYPIVNQFDYVITRALVGKSVFLMDATDRFRPYYLLPQRALNHTGLLVKDDKYEWINIEPVGKGKQITVVNAALDIDGSLSGTVQMSFSDYSASYQRGRHSGEKQEDYVKHLFKTETSGISVDSFQVDRKDSLSASFRVDARIASPAYGQVLNEFIYFNPFVVDRARENPFKLEKRIFPVDFAYPLTNTYTVNLEIPKGYAVKELPKDVSLRLPMNGGMYSKFAQAKENGVQLVERLEIGQVIFSPGEYAGLRKFYEQIVAAENEQLVLQKKPSETQPLPPTNSPSAKPASKRKK